MSFLPYARQSISAEDIERVVDVLNGDFLTTGPGAENLESLFVKATGARYAVSCSSGTAALHLAALAAGLGEGDVAIVPSVTFLATANAVRLTGAEVAFADVDPQTGLLTPDTLEDAIARQGGKRVRAVLPVHLSGQCCDMAKIGERAKAADMMVIEDACHALGGRHANATVGDCLNSDMTMFSLHPAKIVAGGEGGVVTTNDAELAETLSRLRNHGMNREPEAYSQPDMAFDGDGQPNGWYYEMPEIGLNYRLSDIHAVLAASQMERLSTFVERRRELVAAYDARLAAFAPQIRPSARMPDQMPGWHLYSTLWDFESIGLSRNQVMAGLRQQGIGTQVHYIPVHRQPYYRARYGDLHLPGADQYYAAELSLPLHPSMSDDDVARVAGSIEAILRP